MTTAATSGWPFRAAATTPTASPTISGEKSEYFLEILATTLASALPLSLGILAMAASSSALILGGRFFGTRGAGAPAAGGVAAWVKTGATRPRTKMAKKVGRYFIRRLWRTLPDERRKCKLIRFEERAHFKAGSFPSDNLGTPVPSL